MNNPNELYKFNNDDDPLDECPSLQEYLMTLMELISKAEANIKDACYYKALDEIEAAIDVIKEMSVGNWMIRVIEEENSDDGMD